jgi:nucleotide-binding universal stress UspA family protein
MRSINSQVVVGFDFSKSGRAAVQRAIALAARAPSHVLHFICVVEPHSPLPAVAGSKVDYAYTERVHAALMDELKAELGVVAAPEAIHFNVHVRIGKPAQEILRLAKEVGADLIIMGSKGLTGIERFVLGSVSEKVAREAGCSVEIARPKSYEFVELMEVSDVETPHHTYVPPHRYYYEDKRVLLRSADWPIS